VIAVDTNVLVHAHRAEMPRHAACVDVLRRLAEGARGWALPVFVLAEFVRVVTHPRLFDPPSTLAQAFAFLDALLASPRCHVLNPEAGFPERLRRLCQEADMRGNRVYDAQIAAVCIGHGVADILTFDRDMRRMRSIRACDPDAAGL
jgi:toxin-antitoxin system PIN domain toxin